MDEQTFNIIVIIFTVIFVVVGTVIYNSRPDLHNCGLCGKYLDTKDNRYWKKINGENIPICTSCNNH